MAWQIPQSQTNDVGGIVANLGTADDVFVASGVTIASTGNNTILGSGSNHEALIYGTVASAGAADTIVLGNSPILDSDETVTIKPGGQVHNLGGAFTAISIFARESHFTNQGLVASPDGHGILLGGVSAMSTSTIVNSGTIDAGDTAIVRNNVSTETITLQNSGLISGDLAAYAPQFGNPNARDLITNSGQIIGDIFLNAGNDVYNGANGRLSGDVLGFDGNDVITGGVDNDVFAGGDGNDALTGGRGRDTMFGGLDADRFDFNSVKESVKGSNRDQIMHFERGPDHIDLRTIDAKTGVGGNQNFKFIGKDDFSDEKGELRYVDRGATVIVQGDVNGDGKADFEIFVNVGALAKGDFIL